MKHSAPRTAHSALLGFTLIEMLVVIAIIAILAGILFPTVVRSITRANVVKARSEAQNIEAALMLYFNEYGQLPIRDGDHGRNDVANPGGDAIYNRNMFTILMGNDGGFGDNNSYGLNPKQTVFLTTEVPSTDGTYLDPWGTQYFMLIDRNYDESIIYPAGTTAHRKRVVIVSAGPDMDFATMKDNVANVELEVP